jgi:hypothetical protein
LIPNILPRTTQIEDFLYHIPGFGQPTNSSLSPASTSAIDSQTKKIQKMARFLTICYTASAICKISIDLAKLQKSGDLATFGPNPKAQALILADFGKIWLTMADFALILAKFGTNRKRKPLFWQPPLNYV